MKCECRVSTGRTKPRRTLCGRGAALYNVVGMLAGMRLRLCWNHRLQLEKVFGLTVVRSSPLEQLAAKGDAA